MNNGKKLFLCIMLATITLCPHYALAQEDMPALGERTVADISWSRTTEPSGYIVLPVAKWNWSDVEGINTGRTSDVWDGGTVGDRYIGDFRRNWDIATWSTNRTFWDGTCDVRRFQGEFRIPDGYSTEDDVMLSSVGDYSELKLDNIIAINDNIYIFIYPKGQHIDDSNFMQYFAFWTGTASQEKAKDFNNGEPITFHGILGTTPLDYKLIAGEPIPKENLLSHTDGWYCEAFQNNVGEIMKKSPGASEFVIDLFVEDFAEDGGMDRLEITFTKTTVNTVPEVPPVEEPPPEVLPPVVEPPPEVLPPVEEQQPEVLPPAEETPEVLPPVEEIQEETAESPKTGDSNLLPYAFLSSALCLLAHCLIRRKYKRL